MKLKNKEILNANEPLGNLMRERFPVKTSFALVKLATSLKAPIENFEATRKSLIQKYDITVEEGQVKSTQEDGVEKFISEVNELGEEEVDVKIEKFSLPEKVSATCDACKHNMDRPLEIEPIVLMALEKFINS